MPDEPKIPTPKSDAARKEIGASGVDWNHSATLMYEASKGIERQLVEFQRTFVGHVYVKDEEYAAMCENIRQLEQWKKEALKMLPDAQAIGGALNLPLGTLVTPELILERITTMATALREIRDIEPTSPRCLPSDWREQIANCEECQRYKDHPIQGGICNTHRRPILNRERDESNAWKALPGRMQAIASQALSK